MFAYKIIRNKDGTRSHIKKTGTVKDATSDELASAVTRLRTRICELDRLMYDSKTYHGSGFDLSDERFLLASLKGDIDDELDRRKKKEHLETMRRFVRSCYEH